MTIRDWVLSAVLMVRTERSASAILASASGILMLPLYSYAIELPVVVQTNHEALMFPPYLIHR